MNEEEIQKLKEEGKWKICKPDPAFAKRTGYELSARWGASAITRAAAEAESRKDWLQKKESRIKRRKEKAPLRGCRITERQRAVLLKLRIHVPKKCTRAHASRLIGKALNKKRTIQSLHAQMDEQMNRAMALE